MKRKLILASAVVLTACQQHTTLPPVADLDLQRFMGDWHVIAHIPSWPERKATNALESYRLSANGTVETKFTFIREGETETRTLTATGFPDSASNDAVWGMQFLWPIKADYRVAYVDDDYTLTIVARNKRDYLWIMARDPVIPDTTLNDLIQRSQELGYDMTQLRLIPQHSE